MAEEGLEMQDIVEKLSPSDGIENGAVPVNKTSNNVE